MSDRPKRGQAEPGKEYLLHGYRVRAEFTSYSERDSRDPCGTCMFGDPTFSCDATAFSCLEHAVIFVPITLNGRLTLAARRVAEKLK
jgi:hypothetical protein